MSDDNPIDDGGPAFPFQELHDNGLPVAVADRGMSLRDWFAGQALAGLLAREHPDTDQVAGPRTICGMAYDYADRMLVIRKNGWEP